MFHSTPVSEPSSHLVGLLVGFFVYFLAGSFTQDHHHRVIAGAAASTVTNVLVGGKINLLTLDVLALLLVRPLSAWGSYELFDRLLA